MNTEPKPTTGEWTFDQVDDLYRALGIMGIVQCHNAALARMLESRDLWKQWCVNAQDQNQPLREQLVALKETQSKEFTDMQQQLAAAQATIKEYDDYIAELDQIALEREGK